jgi:hypothetical protein
MNIENDRRDQIFELYQLLPTYRYNYTGSQPENMLEATLYYVASRDGKSIEEKTIPCMCGIYIYSKPEDIMVVIIKSEIFVEGGYEYELSPRIDNGSLILTIPTQNLDVIGKLHIWTDKDKQQQQKVSIKHIIISKDTIDQAIE